MARAFPVAAGVLTGFFAACGGGGGGQAQGTTKITVTGKVLDYTGQPAAFLPVRVGGSVTSSDASGNFSVAGVTSPYELVVLLPAQSYAQVFEGVTNPNPIVLATFGGSSSARSATVHVSFAGAGTGTGLLDVSNPVNANGGVSGSVGAPGTSYDDTLNWTGTSSFQANACAILYQATSGVATSFSSYGETDGISVQDGQTSSAGVTMAAVQSKTITGTVTVPSGFTLHSKTLGFVCGNDVRQPSYPFTFDLDPSTSFSYAAPVIGGRLYLGVDAQDPAGDYLYVQMLGVAPDATGVQVVLPAPATQQQPADMALGIDGTAEFSWSGSGGSLSQVYFTPTSVGPLVVTVYTAAGSTPFPDLGSLGYPAPKGATYKWSVATVSSVPTMDAALSGVPQTYVTSYSAAYSGQRRFTTAP